MFFKHALDFIETDFLEIQTSKLTKTQRVDSVDSKMMRVTLFSRHVMFVIYFYIVPVTLISSRNFHLIRFYNRSEV